MVIEFQHRKWFQRWRQKGRRLGSFTHFCRSRFRNQFFHGLDLVLGGFLKGFSREKLPKIAKACFQRKPEKYRFSLGKIDIFKESKITKMKKLQQKTSRKSMFFGLRSLKIDVFGLGGPDNLCFWPTGPRKSMFWEIHVVRISADFCDPRAPKNPSKNLQFQALRPLGPPQGRKWCSRTSF